MYKKQVKIKGKKYNYYYHNFKIDGRVKNICLGNNKEDAAKKLEELLNKNIKQELTYKNLDMAHFKNSSRTFIILLISVIMIGALYYFNQQITGFTVANNNLANVANILNKLNMQEIFGILISLELLFFGYIIYRDHKDKIKVLR